MMLSNAKKQDAIKSKDDDPFYQLRYITPKISDQRDHYLVSIDIPGRRLTVEVDQEEMARRRTAWQRPVREYSGVLRRYVAFVSGAETGAVMSGELIDS